MIFRQLFDRESCTYTYLLGDEGTKEAMLIDPVIELVERDTELIKQLGLTLTYALNTHVHADHITGSGLLKKEFEGCKSVLGKKNKDAIADIKLADGETIKVGNVELECRHTPGHTAGCVSYVCHSAKMCFTGDALLIRGCGRTDFQEGSSKQLYKSVHEKLFTLDDDFFLYPAHDYKGRTTTTVAEEKQFNPRLTEDVKGFVKIMENLNLAYPAKIDVSLPANLVCGLHELLDSEKSKK